MHLYFIRHGQSTNNALWTENRSREGRSEDPELTKLGERQSALLACFLSRDTPTAEVPAYDPKNMGGSGITHLYCSPMIRAIDTAMHIAEALHLRPKVWRDVHETGGIFLADVETGEPVGLPGRTRAYFRERYPELILSDELHRDGWWMRPYEAREERHGRAERVLAADRAAWRHRRSDRAGQPCRVPQLPDARDPWPSRARRLLLRYGQRSRHAAAVRGRADAGGLHQPHRLFAR